MSLTERFTTRSRSLLLAGVMLLGSAIVPLAASAHYMGWPNGHWTWNPWWITLTLPYSRACAANFYTAAGEAASNWNTATRVRLYEVGAYGGVCDGWEHNGRIDMYAFNNPNDSNWGYGLTFTLHTYCFGFGTQSCSQYFDYSATETYNAGVVQLNTAKPTYVWFNPYTPTNYVLMVADVTHELGHTLGLAHAGFYAGEGSGNYSIMDYLTWSYNKPQPHDVNDFNALYPFTLSW
jgi:hypothetical protein